MPVLKVKKNGVWEYVGGVAGGSNLPDYTEEDYGKVLSPSADGLAWTEQTGGNGIITQPDEPTDVEDGTLWIDTDEEDEDVLEASIGDLNNLATTDKTSLVAAINELAASAGGGSGESEFFIITVDAETMTASHSASEILTAYKSGKIVFAKFMPVVLRYSQNTASGAEFTCISNADVTRPRMTIMYIAEDKTVTGNSWYLESAIGQITATVGQIAKVKTIDENGKPTEWEAVDMPSGGSDLPTPTEDDYGKVLSATADGLVWVEQQSGGGSNAPQATEYEW